MKQQQFTNIKFLIGFLTLVLVCTLIFNSFKNKYPNHEEEALFDPILDLAKPYTFFIKDKPRLKSLMMIVLSSGMDVVGVLLMYSFLFKQNASYFIPCIALVQGIRTIALNIVVFPFPQNYIFEDPGFPSVSTSFARTNDFYFSGHIATVTVFTYDALFYNRKSLGGFLVLFLIYTAVFMILQSGHYTNDLLVGFVTAITACRLVYRFRYLFALKWLTLFAKTCYAFDCYRNTIDQTVDKQKVEGVSIADVEQVIGSPSF